MNANITKNNISAAEILALPKDIRMLPENKRKREEFISELYKIKSEDYNMYIHDSSSPDNGTPYNLEFLEAAQTALRTFDNDKGVLFMAYFETVFTGIIKKAEYDRNVREKSHGLSFSNTDEAGNVRRPRKDGRVSQASDLKRMSILHKFLQNNPAISVNDILNNLSMYSESLGFTEKQLKKAVYMKEEIFAGTKSLDEVLWTDGKGNEVTLAETIAHNESGDEKTADVDVLRIANAANELYVKSENGTKLVKSYWLTNMFSVFANDEILFSQIKKMDFFDKDIYITIKENNGPIKNRQIADLSGKSESNATQIFKNFKKMLAFELAKAGA